MYLSGTVILSAQSILRADLIGRLIGHELYIQLLVGLIVYELYKGNKYLQIRLV